METFLQTWLKQKVNLGIDFNEYNHALKDGVIFVKILHRYDAIDIASVKNVLPSDDKIVCKNNLTQLKIWFKLIDIDFSDDVIDGIIGCNLSVCSNILYQLFTVLETRLHLPLKQKERYVKTLHSERFKVTRTTPDKLISNSNSVVYNYSDNLLKRKNLIKWYEKKHTKKKNLRLCKSSISCALDISGTEKYNKLGPSCSKSSHHHSKKELQLLKSMKDKSVVKNDDDDDEDDDEDDNYVGHKHNKFCLSSTKTGIDESSESESCSVCRDETHTHCHTCHTINKFLSVNYIQCSQTQCLTHTPICKYELPLSVRQYFKSLTFCPGFVCKKRVVGLDNLFFKEAWSKVINYDKNIFSNLITRKLFKQSVYERCLIDKLKYIKEQNEIQKTCFTTIENYKNKARRSVVSVNISDSSVYSSISGNTKSVNKLNTYNNSSYDNVDGYNDNNQNSCFDSDKKRYMFNDYITYYISEKKRTVELHRKLYAEKLKLRFERHYAICLHTLDDIIDLAIKRIEFKAKYLMDVPYYIWNDWKCLFNHEQKMYDMVETSNLMFSDEFDAVSEKVRQDILNENNLDACLGINNDTGLLFENSITRATDDDLSISFDSQVLLGYIVHRVLESKYPLTHHMTPAKFPIFSISAIINGINDINFINTFKTLLSKYKILVIDVNTAVSFCLQCYKQHVYEDKVNEVDAQADFYSFTSDDNKVFEDSPFRTDYTQTTNSIFDIDDTGIFEDSVRLGHDLFKVMCGNEIPVSILADIINLYIRRHGKGILGWVLMNFPSTLYQASVLEHAFSQKKFPFHLDDDIVSLGGSDCKGSGLTAFHNDSILSGFEMEVKSSRIVPNPRKHDGEDIFKTYFSMYITTLKGSTKLLRGSNHKYSETCDVDTDSTLLLEQPEKEGVPTLHNFYKDQGIGFDFIYESLDLNMLKQLTRVILSYCVEDFKLQKLPDDVFPEYLSLNIGPKVVLKWYTPKTVSEEINIFKPVKSGLHVEKQETSSIHNNDELSGSNFVNLPILDNAKLMLASFWEALETMYLNKLKELFFQKRKIHNGAIPSFAFINDHMNSYLNREDSRQMIVTQFLYAYNSIHQIQRFDVDMKIELHLRVFELKEKLLKLCEDKRNDVEQMLRKIIDQNWTYQDLISTTNSSVNLMQIEVDRCLGTLEFLQCYYLAMLGNYSHQNIPSLKVSELEVYMGEVSVEPNTGDGISMNYIEHPELVHDELYLSVIDRMSNYGEMKHLPSPFTDLIENKGNKLLQGGLKIKSHVENSIMVEETAVLKKHREYMVTKYSQIPVTAPKKKGRKYSITPSQILENEKKNDEAKEVLLRNLFDEWRQAVNMEIKRLSSRLQLITKEAKLELSEIEAILGNKFFEFSKELNERFLEELTCIDDICFLFHTAIEEKTPINARLIFCQNQFYTIKKPVVKEMPSVKLSAALEEMMLEESFTIKQLEALKERLMFIAPFGIVTRETFIQFIEDLILYSSSDQNFKLVPKSWKRLNRHTIDILIQKLFGNRCLIEWRDFLVYCLSLPYPVTGDVIDAKLQFSRHDMKATEVVSYENYMKTTLWFERELSKKPLQTLRNMLAKEFIFSLFSFDKYTVNYTELLLAFCRDIDPKVGFGKALSLILGRCVIVYEEDLYLEKILTDHIRIKDKVVDEILNEILDDVAHNAMNSEVEDYSRVIEAEAVIFKTPSIASMGSCTGILTQSMYNELFRQHLVFQWTSNVPETAVVALLCLTFYMLYVSDSTAIVSNVFIKIQEQFVKEDDSINVPKFLDIEWMKLLENSHKFTALCVKKIIREILNKPE